MGDQESKGLRMEVSNEDTGFKMKFKSKKKKNQNQTKKCEIRINTNKMSNQFEKPQQTYQLRHNWQLRK